MECPGNLKNLPRMEREIWGSLEPVRVKTYASYDEHAFGNRQQGIVAIYAYVSGFGKEADGKLQETVTPGTPSHIEAFVNEVAKKFAYDVVTRERNTYSPKELESDVTGALNGNLKELLPGSVFPSTTLTKAKAGLKRILSSYK